MAIYMVERDPIGMSLERLDEMQQVVVVMSQRFTEDGRPVKYLRSVYIPSQSQCLSFFESASAAFVRDVNEASQVPFTRIVQVIDLTP